MCKLKPTWRKKGKDKMIGQVQNDMVDAIAKGSLQLGLQTGRFAASILPLEEVWFTREGERSQVVWDMN